MKLYLIRHGQSEGNLRQVFHGQFDYPLTAQGREEALLCGEKLRDVPLVRCCASDLRRARETAELALSGRDVPITLLPALREQNVGDLEGLTWEEMGTLYPELLDNFLHRWFDTTPPGGESGRMMEKRVAAALKGILTRDEDTLIAAHFGTLSLVLHILGIAREEELFTKPWFIRQGCCSAIRWENGRAELLALNA